MRRNRHAVYGFLALFLLVPRLVAPAVIDVHAGPTSCTLSDAIIAANNDKATNWCPKGSGPDTIRLHTDVTLTSSFALSDGPTGLPSVTTEIVIEGNGHMVERSLTAPDFRILHVDVGGDLTLKDVKIRRGSLGGVGPLGGGIFNRGTLVLQDAEVSANVVNASSGIARGGGIYSTQGTLTLRNSSVSNNQSQSPGSLGEGGGISTHSTELEIVDSAIFNNTATGSSALGGGVTFSGSAAISYSSLSNNTAAATGGSSSSLGGAIWGFGLALTNATLSGNTASAASGESEGGAIYGEGRVRQSTFYGNTADRGAAITSGYPDFRVSGSIFAASTGDHCRFIDNLGGNLADAPCSDVPLGLNGLDTVLTDNGGPTPTHALLSGSTAINTGGVCGLGIDQRGGGRMSPCDVGAYEWLGCDLVEVENRSIVGTAHVYSSCHSAVVGPGVEVGGAPDSILAVTAGYLILIRDGVEITSGASVTFTIDPSQLPK